MTLTATLGMTVTSLRLEPNKNGIIQVLILFNIFLHLKNVMNASARFINLLLYEPYQLPRHSYVFQKSYQIIKRSPNEFLNWLSRIIRLIIDCQIIFKFSLTHQYHKANVTLKNILWIEKMKNLIYASQNSWNL